MTGTWRRQAVAMMVVVVAATVVVSGKDCTVARGQCRLHTQRHQLDHGATHTSLNISCYCHESEDVYSRLEEVAKSRCSWVPYTDDLKVDSSAVHIVGCSVEEEPLPSSVLELARRTKHMEIFVKDSPRLRLSPFHPANTLSSLSVTFMNSNISGIPEGVVAGARAVRVAVEGGTVGVVEARAFYFPADEQVNIFFTNTHILTLKMAAFELPPNASLVLSGGQVLGWERSGYSGGGALVMEGMSIGKLLTSAINIRSLHTLTITNCTMAHLYHEALAYTTTLHGVEVGESSATITGNGVISAHGSAFVNLCYMTHLQWRDNSFPDITSPPLRLQDPTCRTQRDWMNVVSLTYLNCFSCEDFRDLDNQTCAIYQTGICLTCRYELDGCNKPILPYLVESHCRSLPSVVDALQTTCGLSAAHSSHRQPKALTGGVGLMVKPSEAVVVGVAVVLGLVALSN